MEKELQNDISKEKHTIHQPIKIESSACMIESNISMLKNK